MKKIILAALAASVVAAPAAAAPFGNHFDRGRAEYQNRDVGQYRGDRGFQNRNWQNRGWQRGQRFDSRYARNYRVIGNPRAYRLHDAPRGYRWVRSGDDAILVAITSGIIGAVLANAF